MKQHQRKATGEATALDYITSLHPDAERRMFTFPIELRAEGDEPKKIRGYAAKFNMETDLGWFREEIAPGAFDSVLNDDVRALFNHDPNYVLARSANGKGTLRLWTDEIGLGFEFTPGNRTYERDLVESIERGDVTQCSFAFSIEVAEGIDREGEKYKRVIKKLSRLYDVSPVTYPAYTDTEVALRHYQATHPETPDPQIAIEAEARKRQLDILSLKK